MHYIYWIIAISTDGIGGAFLKSSEGFSKCIPSLGTMNSFGSCFYFLSKTMQHLRLNITYATCAGLGLVLTFFFQAEDGIRDTDMWLEFRRVLFRSVRPLVSTSYVFAFRRTGQVSSQSINSHLKRANERAGIEKEVTSHMLRHSFASYLFTKGVHVGIGRALGRERV